MSYLHYPTNNSPKSVWCDKHKHWVINFCQKALEKRNQEDMNLIKEAKNKEFLNFLDGIFNNKDNTDG
jgi:hypothetical protein